MTGPLAPLFAQVREALPVAAFAKTPDERHEAFQEIAVVLSALKRHVQDMEKALERIGWHELTWKEARDVARAALPAREKGTETNG